MPAIDPPPGRRIRGLGNGPHGDPAAWPRPDEGALPEGRRLRYLRRKRGLDLYLAGASDRAIRAACGLGLKQVYRLLTERCLETHPDGLIQGYRGLVPHLHIHPYRRTRPVRVDAAGRGASGALALVLELHPDLRRAFEKRILASPAEALGAARARGGATGSGSSTNCGSAASRSGANGRSPPRAAATTPCVGTSARCWPDSRRGAPGRWAAPTGPGS